MIELSRRLAAARNVVLMAFAAAMLVGPGSASAADLSFSVLRDGSQIGTHEVSFRREGDDLHVEVAIDLEVKLAFITLFRYQHRNHEIWRDGRLVSLETRTDDDGTSYSVSGQATSEGFVVDGVDGRLVLPADVMPTSYWHPDTVTRDRLLDTQRGRLMDVGVTKVGTEPVDQVTADRFRLSGDLELDLWYDPAGEWRTLAFSARGSDVTYARRAGTGYVEAVGFLQSAGAR